MSYQGKAPPSGYKKGPPPAKQGSGARTGSAPPKYSSQQGGNQGYSSSRPASSSGKPSDEIVKGAKFTLANFYSVEFPANAAFFRTSIDFYGIQNRHRRRSIARWVIENQLKGQSVRFDGTNLYSTTPITCLNKEWTFELGEDEFQVRLEKCDQINEASADDELRQVLNVVFRQALAEQFTRIGTEYFDTSAPMHFEDRFRDLRESIDIYPGFATSVSSKTFGDKILFALNADTISKVVTKKSVLDLLYDARLTDDNGRLDEKSKGRARSIAGKVVCTPYNFQTYFVEDFETGMSARSTFAKRNRETGESETISFANYVLKEYGRKIEYPDQPLIRTRGRSGTTIYLIPELCVTTNIPAEAKAKLPQVASIKPTQRHEKLQTFLKSIIASDSKVAISLAKFNMKINPSMKQVRSQVLPPPTLVMPIKGKLQQYKTGGRDWKQTARNDIIYQNIKTSAKVHYYIIHDASCRNFMKEYYERLREDLLRIKCPIPFGTVNLVNGDSENGSHVNALQKVVKPHADSDFVLVLQGLANHNEPVNERNYNEVKVFCLARGFHSQALDLTKGAQSKKMDDRSRDTIVNNITRQITNKLGYLSWTMDIGEVIPEHKDKTFLVIGIDVYHAPVEVEKGYTQKRSMGAAVAWLMKGTECQFFNDVFVQKARTEIQGKDAAPSAKGKTPNLSEAERAQAQARSVQLEGETVNGGIAKFVQDIVEQTKTPQKDLVVLVYRDGLSESQLDQARDLEAAQIQKVVPNAQLVFSVVQKATHARFFGSNSPDGNSGDFGNVEPGTLISRDVRMLGWENFYLVPCKNSLSTARPVNYVVVERSPQIKLEDFTKFTWSLHSLYPNWTDTIKLPAPTQCAHKLAFLLGDLPVSNPTIHPTLKRSLFFL